MCRLGCVYIHVDLNVLCSESLCCCKALWLKGISKLVIRSQGQSPHGTVLVSLRDCLRAPASLTPREDKREDRTTGWTPTL